MRSSSRSRVPNEASDAVGLIVALLVRFPEIATIVLHPKDGTLTLSFAIESRVDRRAEVEIRESVSDHVRLLLDLGRDEPDTLGVAFENDRAASFVRLTRDVRSFSREELQVLVVLLSDRFPTTLVRSPAPADDGFEDEAADDDLVDFAIEAMRDPAQQRSLVGFREEKRVLVYFVKSRKKAKARARS
ncbi:MAG: hypothetical protein IAI49_12500 [Candidatus Eremiobacteraeota bacterium]|nr:hypothetical protein [Candidatus Eremiobacteraeota bacterium]